MSLSSTMARRPQAWICSLLLLLMPSCTAAEPTSAPAMMPAFSTTEKEQQREAGRQALAHIKQAAASGASTVRLEPGDYRFAQPDFVLRGLSDITIEAEGVRFWFEYQEQAGIKLEKCRNVTLRGLTIDYDPLPFSQGVIREIDRAKHQIVIEIEPGYPLPNADWIKAAEKMGPFKALFFDPTGKRQLDVRLDWTVGLEPLGERRFRLGFSQAYPFKNATSEDIFQVGDRYVLPYRRHQPAIALNHCADLTLEGITVYTSPAMGIVEWNGEGRNRYVNCRVLRRPGTDRLISVVADAFHSGMMETGPTVEDCQFAHAGDDLIAVHGFFSVVLEQRSPTELVLASVFEGDVVPHAHLQFYDVKRGTPAAVSAVRSVRPLQDQGLKQRAYNLPRSLYQQHQVNIRCLVTAELNLVTLAAPVKLPAYALASTNERCGSGAVIRRNHLHDARVRGIAVRADDAIITDNHLARLGMGGITVTPDRFFLESAYARNLLIANNTIEDCGETAFNQHYLFKEHYAAIIIGSDFGPHFNPVPLHGEIVIRDNKIIRPAGPGILMANVAGGLIEGNTIQAPYQKLESLPKLPRYDPESSKWLAPPLAAIGVMASRDVIIQNNTMTDAPAKVTDVVALGPWNKPQSIEVEDNHDGKPVAANTPSVAAPAQP